jgi:predicted permease
MTEVALGIVVVVMTTVMVRSLVRLEEVNPGVRTENVLTFGLEAGAGRFPNEASVASFFDQILERVRGVSGVEDAAVGTYLPLTTLRRSWRFSIEGRPATSSGDDYFAVANEVSRGFFSTLGIGLLAGRVFDHTDRADSPPVVVMSQTAARRFWPNGGPIGERIKVAGIDAWFTVVGVAADVHQEKLDTAPLPALYVLHDQSPNRSMTLVVRAYGGVDSLVDSVRAAIHVVDPNQPIDRIQSMDNLRRGVLGEPRFRAHVLAFFAASALLLAAVGIYAVTSQLSKERRGEIGVRMALGATWSDVALLVMRKAMQPVGAGLVVGTLVAWGVTQLLRGLLFGVTPSDPTSFLIAGGVLLILALLASSLPAHKAARADPLQVLRQE